MVATVVQFDGTRVSAAENATDGGVWDKWQAVQAPSVEPDFFYQGAASLSNKVGTSAGGVEMDASTGTHDFETVPKIWLAKVNATNYQSLNVRGSTGMILYLGSANTNHQYEWYVFGSDNYPLLGGWLIIPLDPNVAGYRDNTVGTPDLTAVNYFAVSCDFTATSKSENVMMDAIDYFDVGTGLTMTRGDGVPTDGTFKKFAEFDEEGLWPTVSTADRRYGIVTTIDSIFFVRGVITIGDNSVQTDFTDSGQTVVFPEALASAGWCGLNVDTRIANSVCDIQGCTFVSRGTKTGSADTRPNYDIIGPAGSNASCTFLGCAFREFRNLVLSEGNSLTDCVISRGEGVTQNDGMIHGCAFDGGTHGDGAAYLLSDQPAEVQDCTFEWNDGHAIEIDTVGTYNFKGNKFSGYHPDDEETDSAIYNNSGGLVTLNITGGGDTAPSVRNGAGASTIINVTVTLTIRVRQQDGTFLGLAQCAIYQASDDTQLMNEDSDGGTGNALEDFNYPGSDVDVYIRVRKSSSGQRYVNNSTTATITDTGLDVTMVMQEDTNIDL